MEVLILLFQAKIIMHLKVDGVAGPKTLTQLMGTFTNRYGTRKALDTLALPKIPDEFLIKNKGINWVALNSQMYAAMPKIAEVWKTNNAGQLMITSGNDSSEHVKNSKHYEGKAIDLRGQHLSNQQMKTLANNLQTSLGADYQVLAEFFPSNPARDHIHVAYVG